MIRSLKGVVFDAAVEVGRSGKEALEQVDDVAVTNGGHQVLGEGTGAKGEGNARQVDFGTDPRLDADEGVVVVVVEAQAGFDDGDVFAAAATQDATTAHAADSFTDRKSVV